MLKYIYPAIKTMRPRQWLKNLSLFGTPALMWNLHSMDVFIPTVKAFFIFCMISSGAYYINDLVDADKDRNHPVKKNRPIASGALPRYIALLVASILLVGALVISRIALGTAFTLLAISFVLLQFMYSFYLKKIVLLDTLAIAMFFVLRVFAGGIASQTSISSWLFLTTIGLALLLAFGKRRSEKTLFEDDLEKIQTRETLKVYPKTLLDRMLSVSATICLVSYAVFAFQTSPEIMISFMPSVLSEVKLFMISIPLVFYGVGRYLFVVFEKKEGETPDKVLTTDLPLILTVTTWLIIVITINLLTIR